MVFNINTMKTYNREQLFPSKTEYLIMKALREIKEGYGIDIKNYITKKHGITLQQNSLYPAILHADLKGFIEKVKGPHVRKYYRITDKGKHILEIIEDLNHGSK